MRFAPRHLLAVAAMIAAVSVAAPVSTASAASRGRSASRAHRVRGARSSTRRVTSASSPAQRSSTLPVNSPTSTNLGGQAGSFGCGSNAPAEVGPAGGVTNQVCGGGLTFIGPSVGQIATVVGPTIIGSTVVGPVTTTAGPVKN